MMETPPKGGVFVFHAWENCRKSVRRESSSALKVSGRQFFSARWPDVPKMVVGVPVCAHSPIKAQNDKMLRARLLNRVFAIAAVASLSVGSTSAQSLAAIARRGYEAPAGPWLTKYVTVLPGATAPELTVTKWLNRQPTTLHALRTRLVLLYFWATWCGACPAGLAKLHQIAHDSPIPLEIITVHLSSGSETVVKPASIATLTSLPVAIDQGTTAIDYGIKAVPAYVLVDSAGRVRFVHIRPPTSQEIGAAADALPEGTRR